MKIFYLCFASLAMFFALFASVVARDGAARSDDNTPLIAAADLQADFAVLKKAYEAMHPGLYRYNSKAQMDAHFAALRAEFDRDLSLRQAYLAFSIFLAKIKCGHSYPNFFNQPQTVADALFKNQDKVPFYFRWIDRRMIVTRNFSGDARLAPGAEVLAVNGVPAQKILARLLTVARADGNNDAKRVSYLEIAGNSNYEAFDVYYPMFFPLAANRFELRVKTLSARRIETLNVASLTYEQRLAPIKAATEARRGAAAAERIWDFTFFDERTAYLRMPTWALYDSKWDWKSFLENSFDQLTEKKTAHLIIDLRGNEGGLSVGDVILSRLIKRDTPLEQFKRLVRYRKAPDELLPFLDTWDKSFKDWGAAAIEQNDGFYRLTRYDDNEKGSVIKASPRPFSGRTFVLVGAANSSATFEFAQAAQQNKLATLVGQPTGGNRRGINGGAFFFLRLPKSKIEIDLPLIGFFPPGAPPNAGLEPDIAIKPAAEDAARNVDTELKILRQRLQNLP